MAKRFLKGALIGAALGVAAGLMLAPEEGKKFQKDAKKKYAKFYAEVAPKLKKMREVGEKDFKIFIKQAAENYAKAKKMSEPERRTLGKEAQALWKHLSKHA